MRITWPCYLTDCVSPRWKSSHPCIQFWAGFGDDASPRTLTFSQFDAYSSELCEVLTQHSRNWTGKYSVLPLVIIIWSPHILTSVVVHAAAKARMGFFPISCDFSSIFNEIEAFALAVIDLTESERFTSISKNFFVYSMQTKLFGDCDLRLFLRDPSTVLPKIHIGVDLEASSHLAYMITSSGSSGGPGKIAFISDACLTANISDLCTRFEPLQTNQKSVLLTAPLTFDPSLVQIYFALATGRCLTIPGSGLLCHPDSMAFFCSTAHVDWLQCTPNLFMLQSQESRNRLLQNSELNIIMGGETFPLKLLESCECIKATVYNIYGVTEVSCWATLCQIGLRTSGEHDRKRQCSCLPPSPGLTPIGFPMLGTNITLHPVGDKNEIVLSRGNAGFAVLRRNGCPISVEDYQSSICTLQHPRPWSTGDLVVSGSCGKCLWFAGRKDRTTKRLGHQICLETLEAAISNCKFRWIDIKNCQCKLASLRGGPILLAFVWIARCRVGHSVRFSSAFFDRIRHQIVCYLRTYFGPVSAPWIPTKIVFYDGAPRLSTHGKISRLASANSTTLRVDVLSTFRVLMAECGIPLNLSKSFYDVGGSSLQAIQLIEALAERHRELSNFKGTLLAKLLSVNIAAFRKFLTFCCESPIGCRPARTRRTRTSYLRKLPPHFDNYAATSHFSESADIITSGSVQFHSCLHKPSGFHHRWKKPYGKCIDASAVVYASHSAKSPVVCVGSHSGQFAVSDLRTGKSLWSVNLNERIESSPTVGFDFSDPTVVVGTLSGNVHGLQMQSGRNLWSVSVDGAVKSAPLFLPQKSVFVLGSHGRRVYAIDPRSPPSPVWVSDFDGSPIVAPISATNSVMLDQIFVGSLGGTVGCIDLRNPRRTIWSHGGISPVFSKPTIFSGSSENPCVIVTPVDSSVLSYSAVTGQCLWKTCRLSSSSNVFKDSLHSPTKNDLLIASNDGMLFSVNASDGACIWRESFISDLLPGEPASLNTPSLVHSTNDSLENQFLLLSRADGSIFLCGYRDANVNKAKSPISVIGSTKLPGLCFSNPVVFSKRESDECLVVIGCRDDNLHCFSVIND